MPCEQDYEYRDEGETPCGVADGSLWIRERGNVCACAFDGRAMNTGSKRFCGGLDEINKQRALSITRWSCHQTPAVPLTISSDAGGDIEGLATRVMGCNFTRGPPIVATR